MPSSICSSASAPAARCLTDIAVNRRVGLVHVNGETAGAEPHVPFGGMRGSSSWSREQGKSAAEFFTQTRTVYVEGLPTLGPFDR